MLITLGGLLIWAIVDAFLIPGMLRADEQKIRAEVLGEIAMIRESAPSSPRLAYTEGEQRKMSYCPKCGSKIAEGGLFCSACGSKLGKIETTQ